MRGRTWIAFVVGFLLVVAVLMAAGVVKAPWASSLEEPSVLEVAPPGNADADQAARIEAAELAAKEGGAAKKARTEEASATAEDGLSHEVKGTALAGLGATVRGRVVSGPAKAAVEGARVRLTKTDSLFAYFRAKREGRFDDVEARTDAEGRFVLRDVLPAMGYVLTASIAKGARGSKSGIELSAREAYDAGDLLLGASGGLAGTVTGADGKPLAGARVVAAPVIKNEFQVVLADPDMVPGLEAQTTTDAQGAWVLESLEPGDKTLVFRATTGASEVLSPITSPSGEIRRDVNAMLGGPLAIAGKVLFEGGAPIQGARVFAKPTMKPAAFTMDTGPDGSFRIADLTEGSYMVGVLVPGLPIKIEQKHKAGEESLRFEFPQPGSLVGRVVAKGSGKAVGAFEVTATFTGDQGNIEQYVSGRIAQILGPTSFRSADGSFRFDRLQPGPYTLVVASEGYPATIVNELEVVAGRETTAPTIELPEGNRATGRVLDAAQTGIANARIYLMHPEIVKGMELEDVTQLADEEPVTRTDVEGRFETPPQTPQLYELAVVATGKMPVHAPLDLRSGPAKDLKYVLPLEGRILVRLVDHLGRSVAKAGVVLAHASGVVRYERVGGEEEPTIGPLREGPWVVAFQGREAVKAIDGPVAAGSEDARYRALAAVAGARSVQVEGGKRPEVVLRMPRLVRVRGRVRGLTTSIPTPSAYMQPPDGRGTSGAAQIDGEGRFTIEGLEPGTYQVWFPVRRPEGDLTWKNVPATVPDQDECDLDLQAPQ